MSSTVGSLMTWSPHTVPDSMRIVLYRGDIWRRSTDGWQWAAVPILQPLSPPPPPPSPFLYSQIVRAQLFSFCYETAERRKQEMASWNIDLEARLGCLCSLWAEYKRERERERGKKFRIGLCNASSISFSSETEWPPQNRVVSQLLVHFCAARVFQP